jgi:hypothetical protein
MLLERDRFNSGWIGVRPDMLAAWLLPLEEASMADRPTDPRRADHPQSWGEANRRDRPGIKGSASPAAPLPQKPAGELS